MQFFLFFVIYIELMRQEEKQNNKKNPLTCQNQNHAVHLAI